MLNAAALLFGARFYVALCGGDAYLHELLTTVGKESCKNPHIYTNC